MPWLDEGGLFMSTQDTSIDVKPHFNFIRFSNLVGTDYSQSGVDLAIAIAQRSGLTNMNFIVMLFLFLWLK